jgi:hypothetical protein
VLVSTAPQQSGRLWQGGRRRYRAAPSDGPVASEGGGEGAAEPTREWVEQLLLDRERLRRQLREAGLEPCC